MISRYEQERLRERMQRDEEKGRRIVKGQEMWDKAQNLLQRRGQDFDVLGSKELYVNDFNVVDFFTAAYNIRYLVEDVDLGEEEPTTLVIKSFKRTGEVDNSPFIEIWAHEMYHFVQLFESAYLEPQRFYRVTKSPEKPIFDCANGNDPADMKLLGLYDHILNRLAAKAPTDFPSK